MPDLVELEPRNADDVGKNARKVGHVLCGELPRAMPKLAGVAAGIAIRNPASERKRLERARVPLAEIEQGTVRANQGIFMHGENRRKA